MHCWSRSSLPCWRCDAESLPSACASWVASPAPEDVWLKGVPLPLLSEKLEEGGMPGRTPKKKWDQAQDMESENGCLTSLLTQKNINLDIKLLAEAFCLLYCVSQGERVLR